MKEELTDGLFRAWLGDASVSPKCVWASPKPEYITRLARMYFEEMDKPRVWDGAPEDAIEASVAFFKKGEYLNHVCKTYTRELPKTRTRQIAEEICDEVQKAQFIPNVDAVESLLNKYAAELGTTT